MVIFNTKTRRIRDRRPSEACRTPRGERAFGEGTRGSSPKAEPLESGVRLSYRSVYGHFYLARFGFRLFGYEYFQHTVCKPGLGVIQAYAGRQGE